MFRTKLWTGDLLPSIHAKRLKLIKKYIRNFIKGCPLRPEGLGGLESGALSGDSMVCAPSQQAQSCRRF